MVDPLFIAVTSTVAGACLNTVRGYINSGERYSIKKLVGAIIPTIFAGIAVGQTLSVTGVSTLAIALIGLTAGFAVDYAISKAKKDTSSE